MPILIDDERILQIIDTLTVAAKHNIGDLEGHEATRAAIENNTAAFAALTSEISNMSTSLATELAETTAAMNRVNESVRVDWSAMAAKISDLESQLANAVAAVGSLTPEQQAAFDAVQTQATALADEASTRSAAVPPVAEVPPAEAPLVEPTPAEPVTAEVPVEPEPVDPNAPPPTA